MIVGPPVDHGWHSHQPLLRAALEVTEGPVLELGCGDGSTPFLHGLCAGKRILISMDADAKWVDRYEAQFVTSTGSSAYHGFVRAPDWAAAPIESWFHDGRRWAVALVDHAPGERRIHDIARLAPICDIVVVHDTEPGQARAGYGYDAIWSLFKHLRHDTRLNTWTTALSNTVDVTQWQLPSAAS